VFKKILFLFFIFFISGCVQSNKNTVMYHSFPDIEKKKKVKKVDNLPNRVAILPFYSKNYEASKIVTNAFYNFFSILPYEDVEISEIYDIFHKKTFNINTKKETLNKICNQLEVDGLIYGNVKNFGKLYLGLYSEVSVGAKLKFYNCNTQKIIFTFDNVAKKREGGISTTPFGLALNALLSAYNLRKLQVYRAAEDLFRNIPKIIPHRKYLTKTIIKPPKFIWHSGYKKDVFGIGDKISIKIAAEKGLKIKAKITGINDEIVLKETKDGIYTGIYTVKPFQNTKGYLKIICDKNSNRQVFYDYVSKINIDTTPPKLPKINTTYTDNNLILKFENINEDIYKYELLEYKSHKFTLFKTAFNNKIIIPYTNKTLNVKLRVRDKAGNYNESKIFTIYLYKVKDIAKSKIYNNEKIIKNIVRLENNVTIDELYIDKSGHLIIMPNVMLKINKLVDNGSLTLLNAKLTANNIIINNKANIIKSTIDSQTFGLRCKKRAKVTIADSIINSKFAALKLEDYSKALVNNSILISKDVFSTVLISNYASIVVKNCKFSNNLYNIVSTSAINSYIDKNLKVKGNVVKN
jgi:hypothetical protein